MLGSCAENSAPLGNLVELNIVLYCVQGPLNTDTVCELAYLVSSELLTPVLGGDGKHGVFMVWKVLLHMCCLYWLMNKEAASAYDRANRGRVSETP